LINKQLRQKFLEEVKIKGLFRIVGEENLLNGVTQTGFCADFHFRFFDDLRAMLHLDADARALIFVSRMAHTETAQAPRLIYR
jgi:hypothetical protein